MKADQVEVMPLKSFEHGDTIRAPRKGSFMIDRATARAWRVEGKVEIVGDVARTPKRPRAKKAAVKSCKPEI